MDIICISCVLIIISVLFIVLLYIIILFHKVDFATLFTHDFSLRATKFILIFRPQHHSLTLFIFSLFFSQSRYSVYNFTFFATIFSFTLEFMCVQSLLKFKILFVIRHYILLSLSLSRSLPLPLRVCVCVNSVQALASIIVSTIITITMQRLIS